MRKQRDSNLAHESPEDGDRLESFAEACNRIKRVSADIWGEWRVTYRENGYIYDPYRRRGYSPRHRTVSAPCSSRIQTGRPANERRIQVIHIWGAEENMYRKKTENQVSPYGDNTWACVPSGRNGLCHEAYVRKTGRVWHDGKACDIIREEPKSQSPLTSR